MKKLAVIAIIAATGLSAFGQGQIFLNNRVIGSVVAPVYGVNPNAPTVRLSGNATTNGGTQNYTGIPLVTGTNFTAQLWYGPAGTAMDALQAVTTSAGTTTFRTVAAAAGFITPPLAAATLNGVDFGQTAAIQLRVWDNQGGTITSWAQALAANVATGFSDVFTSPVLSAPPAQPPNMVGLTSFNLTQVPEPSVIALGVLGLGALLLRRKKA